MLGWVLLRGRCRHCRAALSIQYPLVEATTGLIWAGSFHAWGLEWEALRAALLFTILLGIAVSDARFYVIPDEFSLGGAALGIGLAFAPGGITPASALVGAVVGFVGFHVVGVVGTRFVRWRNPERLEQAFSSHDEQREDPVVRARVARLARPGLRGLLIGGAVALGGVGWAVGRADGAFVALAVALSAVAVLLAWAEAFHETTFEEERAAAEHPSDEEAPASALGGGDVRMMALVGAFLGPMGVALTTLGGSLLALLGAIPLTLLFRQLIPLGIFLAYAAAATWLHGDAVIAAYRAWAGF